MIGQFLPFGSPDSQCRLAVWGKGNLSFLVPDGTCLGLYETIRIGYTLVLDDQSVWARKGHMEGDPSQYPFNLSTYVRTSNRQVEIEQVTYLLRLLKRFGTRIT